MKISNFLNIKCVHIFLQLIFILFIHNNIFESLINNYVRCWLVKVIHFLWLFLGKCVIFFSILLPWLFFTCFVFATNFLIVSHKFFLSLEILYNSESKYYLVSNYLAMFVWISVLKITLLVIVNSFYWSRSRTISTNHPEMESCMWCEMSQNLYLSLSDHSFGCCSWLKRLNICCWQVHHLYPLIAAIQCNWLSYWWLSTRKYAKNMILY